MRQAKIHLTRLKKKTSPAAKISAFVSQNKIFMYSQNVLRAS